MDGSPDAAEAAKRRVRDDLKAAMREKDALRVRVLRALVAAIDDAQAPPVGERHDRYVVHAFGDRTAEVARLSLSKGEVRALFTREAEARRAAGGELSGLGKPEQAAVLLREAEAMEALASAAG